MDILSNLTTTLRSRSRVEERGEASMTGLGDTRWMVRQHCLTYRVVPRLNAGANGGRR
jgi:hypothetical protein